MTQEDYEPKLSFVTLDDDNETILLNGEPKNDVTLPVNISRKNAADKRDIIEKLILDGCDKFGFDYVSEENIRNLAKEVVDRLYERPRDLKIVDSVSDVIRMNKGQVILTAAKIVGVSPPYKMIAQVILECPVCKENGVSDFHDKPQISFRPDMRYCPNCKHNGGDRGDLRDLRIIYEHVDAKSITLQDVDVIKEDIEKLHVILLEDQTRNVRVGETVSIKGDVDVLNPSGSGGKKATTIMYAKQIKYEREEEAPITDDDVNLFKQFAQKSTVINDLVEMFAPQVFGHSDAKLGILRSAVSVRESKAATGIRSRVQTLFAGDPGTAKSMLAEEAVKIVPNSRFVTAQHISVKSALAIIDKEVDGSKMLMLGAVPQARNAFCAINEIGSMLFEDQQHLADVLEEGKFTIDKYGIYQEISSPTTIIATTNPHGGRWNRSAGPSMDQIPVKDNILDRFDQVYIFEDFQTTEERREYATKKMDIYQNPANAKPDYDFLKRYLQYAASQPDPVLSPEAAIMLSNFWLRMTEEGIAANRSLDSLVRMAKAQARLHLYTEIDPDIANELTTQVHLMLVKIGKRIDPSVADPRDLAYNEIIQYVNTLDDNTHIGFIEAAKHVCDTNNSVKQYLGGTVWAVNSNKKLRAVMDRFTNGGTDKPKVGRGGLAVIITNLQPLTFAKAERQQQEHKPTESTAPDENTERAPESPRSPELDLRANYRDLGHEGGHDTSPENELKTGESDPRDLSDHHDLTSDLSQMIEKCLLDGQGNNKGYLTKNELKTRLMLLPVQDPLHCDEDEADQTWQALLEEGRLTEVQPGRFKPTTV